MAKAKTKTLKLPLNRERFHTLEKIIPNYQTCIQTHTAIAKSLTHLLNILKMNFLTKYHDEQIEYISIQDIFIVINPVNKEEIIVDFNLYEGFVKKPIRIKFIQQNVETNNDYGLSSRQYSSIFQYLKN